MRLDNDSESETSQSPLSPPQRSPQVGLKVYPECIREKAEKTGRAEDRYMFQKVQQPYNLFTDPVRRSHYDDKIKLAEMRKEDMMMGSLQAPTYTMSTRTTPDVYMPGREFRDNAAH